MLSSICLYSCIVHAIGVTEIKVSGDGFLEFKPTAVEMPIFIRVDDAAYEKAKNTAQERYAQLIEKLKTLGVEESDIKIDKQGGEANPRSKNGSNLYTYRYAVLITIRDLKNIASIAELAPAFSIDMLDIVRLRPMLDNLSVYLQEARNAAVNDAREKAEQLAKAIGLKITDVQSMSETNPIVGYEDQTISLDKEKLHDALETFLSRKTVSITSHVEITFRATVLGSLPAEAYKITK